MAVLNLRGVNDGLAAFLKAEASMAGLPLREYCIAILEMRGQLGLTWGRLEQWQQERQREEGNNGKEKVAEVVAEKAGEIGQENRPAGIQGDGVRGKGGSVRAPKKGFEVGNNAKIATGGSAGVAAAGISPEGKRGVQKGAAGDHGKLLRGQSGAAFNERSRPENPIETDAVGTTGCKVTVSRAMAGRPAHAGNCQCLTCKPPKENI